MLNNLKLEDVVVALSANNTSIEILNINALSVPQGVKLGVSGASGSGKTTLISVIAGLLNPQNGSVFWGEKDLLTFKEYERDRWRAQTIGFVFQDFRLIPELTVLENILLPLTFSKNTLDYHAAKSLAMRMGLTEMSRKASVLSRGEQQRVAIARALISKPALIIADEPTASLDEENAAIVRTLLIAEATQLGATLLCVSHDARLLAVMDRVVRLEKGRLV